MTSTSADPATSHETAAPEVKPAPKAAHADESGVPPVFYVAGVIGVGYAVLVWLIASVNLTPTTGQGEGVAIATTVIIMTTLTVCALVHLVAQFRLAVARSKMRVKEVWQWWFDVISTSGATAAFFFAKFVYLYGTTAAFGWLATFNKGCAVIILASLAGDVYNMRAMLKSR